MVEGVGTGSGWEPWPSAVAVRSQRTAYLLLQAAFGSIPVMTQLMTEAAWENEVAKCSALTEVCSCLVKKKGESCQNMLSAYIKSSSFNKPLI